MLYLYIARDEKDFDDCANAVKPIFDSTLGVIHDRCGNRKIVMMHRAPVCRHLSEAIGKGAAAEIDHALQELTTLVKKLLGAGAAGEITVLIHFGGQGREECRVFTRLMNEAAVKNPALAAFRFLAVSKTNQCPDGFFRDNRLSLPDDASVDAVLRQWRENASEIPVYDHLRAIVLLCQTLRNMSKEKRGEKFSWRSGVEWWRSCLWGNENPVDTEHAFSTAEMQILKKNGLLNDFCSALLDNPFNLKKYDDDDMLHKIVDAVTEALKNE